MNLKRIKQQPPLIPECYRTFIGKAISLYCDAEKYKTAGRLQKQLAEWNRTVNNFEKSILQYQKASSYYLAEKMDAQSGSCLFQAALLMGSIEIYRYEDASNVLSGLGEELLHQNLQKFQAKEYFFRSGLLLLAMKPSYLVRFDTLLEKFMRLDPTFMMSHYFHFLRDLKNAMTEKNLCDFADQLYYFSRLIDIDHWTLQLLNQIQSHLEVK